VVVRRLDWTSIYTSPSSSSSHNQLAGPLLDQSLAKPKPSASVRDDSRSTQGPENRCDVAGECAQHSGLSNAAMASGWCDGGTRTFATGGLVTRLLSRSKAASLPRRDGDTGQGHRQRRIQVLFGAPSPSVRPTASDSEPYPQIGFWETFSFFILMFCQKKVQNKKKTAPY
jgi:hypothetical protein